MQKKHDSFTCSFLALTYWFNSNLMSILKKFSLFPTKPYFCFYCATHYKQLDEISKFQVEKKKSQFELNQYVNAKSKQVNESRFFCTRVY